MRTFYIVKGKQGILVGDPTAPGRFIGQKRKTFEPGEYPQKLGDRYTPENAAAPKSPHILKAIKREELVLVKKLAAKTLADARKVARALNPKPPPNKKDDSE